MLLNKASPVLIISFAAETNCKMYVVCIYFIYFLVMQQDQYAMLEHAMNSMAGGFDPSSNLYCSQASLMGLSGSHGNLQDSLPMKANMLYSNCGGAVPNIILTGNIC